MTIPAELQDLIESGESMTVEFKESGSDITKDVYETVCSFSNRNGGHIFLGVKNDGNMIVIRDDRIDKIKKQFVTTINNSSKMSPPLYLTPRFNTKLTGNRSFTFMCRFHRMWCAAPAEYGTGTKTRILISRITRMRYIGFMPENAEVSL